MTSTRRATKRRRRLTWEVLSVFVLSFLHLCTLSPQVHAALMSQLPRADRVSATGHCASPPAASHSTTPFTDHHQPTTEPVCCNLMGEQKGRVVSPVQAEFFPVLWLVHRSFTAESFAWRVSHNCVMQILPLTRHCPSLYLLHTLLVI